MRVGAGSVVVVALVMAAWMAGGGGGVAGQMALGPGGFSTPPINLISVLRLLRRVFSSVTTYPPEQPKLEDVCVEEDEKGQCLKWEMQEVEVEDNNAEEKIGTNQLLVGKWPLLYSVFIIVTSILIIIVATPYLITGEPYITRSLNTNSLMEPSNLQDTALLLSWLLGEAGGSEECLQRLVCDMPERSSFYLDHAASLLYFIPRSWVPARYQAQVQRLGRVRNEGYDQQCNKYHCPDLDL